VIPDVHSSLRSFLYIIYYCKKLHFSKKGNKISFRSNYITKEELKKSLPPSVFSVIAAVCFVNKTLSLWKDFYDFLGGEGGNWCLNSGPHTY
jgi:hypothetical protein